MGFLTTYANKNDVMDVSRLSKQELIFYRLFYIFMIIS
jgi:hypothetical protein